MTTEGQLQANPGSIQVIPGPSRGHCNHGWLDTYHTFSFGDYHEPTRMGYRSLRVMNEDRVAPGMGFGTHPHRDMEILTYVLDGTLFHQDSLGHGGPIRPGEFQRMTAGTGIRHGERNASDVDPIHFYQIWIVPDRKNLEPGYEQKSFDEQGRLGRWQLVGSNDGRDASITIHQDAALWMSRLAKSDRLTYDLPEPRYAWLQVVKGSVELNGQALLQGGDGATIAGGTRLSIEAAGEAEVLLFDLA